MTKKKKYNDGLKKLTRADVDASDDLQEQWFPIEAWKGQVLMRAVSYETYEAITEQAKSDDGGKSDEEQVGMLLLSKCLIDADTKEPMYRFDEIVSLKKKSMWAFTQLAEAVSEINHTSELEKKTSGAVSLQTENGATPSN